MEIVGLLCDTCGLTDNLTNDFDSESKRVKDRIQASHVL